MRKTFLTLGLLATSSALSAQIGVDPQAELRRIAEKVADEMQEIDRLLSTGKAGEAAAQASARAAEGLQKMLDDAGGSSQRVQKGIDELMEALQQCGL